MAKQYTLDKLQNLAGRIKFNHTETNEEVTEYYILRLEFNGKGMNGGASKVESVGMNIGTSQSEPFTSREIYLKVKETMGTAVANKLKDLYVDLIDDDISI